jgi:hypothetical protein
MANHIWKFFRAGGFDQVRLDTGADLLSLDELDQKLWVALACPTTGLEFDADTLALIDSDQDGRIRAPELIAAVKWAGACLRSPDDLLKGTADLPLSAINEATPEGRQVLAAARQILANLGKPEAMVVTLEDTTDTVKILAQTRFNGDGVIPPDAAEDPATAAVITDIITCLGAETDRSGLPGVSESKVEQFFTEARACSEYWQVAEADPVILPLGPATPAAADAVRAVKAKVEDYFTRCRLAAFDPRSATALHPGEKDYAALTIKELHDASTELAGFPLAQPDAGKPLPLKEGLNPAWAAAMAKLEVDLVRPLLGEQPFLTEAGWAAMIAKLVAYEAWAAAKPGTAVERLGLARVREILAGESREAIAKLIARDRALSPEYDGITAVGKLVRYHRDLGTLVNNFVSFRDFYGRKARAIFQAGTLYLDQRSCELCLPVNDPGKHAVMAGLSGTYLAYCDCIRKGSGEKMQIVAAFTNGDSDNLMVGRNGIFYDRQGRDWDAAITKIVDNPISIRQAFWSPYKKAVRMVQEQIAKRAANADQAAVTRLTEAAAKGEQAATKGPATAPEPPKKMDPGLIAAIGVGAAGLGGMVGGLLTGFLNLKGLMPLGVLAIILLISGPSMVLAWLKLRKRNLGPILDANGWAVNAKAKINVPFGASLTRVAVLPSGAQRDLADPFAEKKRPWRLYCLLLLIVLLALGWAVGKFDTILSSVSPRITSSWVLHRHAPPDAPASEVKPAEEKK